MRASTLSLISFQTSSPLGQRMSAKALTMDPTYGISPRPVVMTALAKLSQSISSSALGRALERDIATDGCTDALNWLLVEATQIS